MGISVLRGSPSCLHDFPMGRPGRGGVRGTLAVSVLPIPTAGISSNLSLSFFPAHLCPVPSLTKNDNGGKVRGQMVAPHQVRVASIYFGMVSS